METYVFNTDMISAASGILASLLFVACNYVWIRAKRELHHRGYKSCYWSDHFRDLRRLEELANSDDGTESQKFSVLLLYSRIAWLFFIVAVILLFVCASFAR